MKIFISSIFCLIFAINSFAEDVKLELKGLTTTANLITTSDQWLERPVVLMLHGTLAHNKMEIMSELQDAFKENNISSLSINLSLGLSNRTGMYPCSTPHKHKHTDALDEINLWINWLKKQGVKAITLLGHSRGGNQIAWYASEYHDDVINQVVLIAPGIISPGELAREYEKKYQKPLQPILDKATSLVASGKANEMMKNIDFIYCPKTTVSAESFVNYHQENSKFYTPKLVKRIQKPVKIFSGSEDKVVDNVETEMSKVSQLDNVDLHTIDGADHFFRDLYIEEVVEFILEELE